ncbi:3-oxo-5-alpha-steroid 4-dehydrogenase 1 [Echinops telfairi]|uniref:3-oxo-5-alpha-steroid 4-dehydrogenase 1 n=1 Tax=Echinops telfairi TaxID=9371 RepID=A0ABM0IER1_ECHTE|nr:3-oxo-5-alpha-steroid 4-dehydrogenase 1 [Echinops telfairi]
MQLGEPQLLDALGVLLGVSACFTFVILQKLETSYGRYWSPRIRWWLPARLAWGLQEMPSLLLPLLEWVRFGDQLRPPNALLMAMFTIHYTQRTLIFPLLIRGGKPTPLSTFLMAFLFCTHNGYLQSRYLSLTKYPDHWTTQPHFLAGGLFEYVTAANYFGEIVEWLGFALAGWSIQSSAFALFTFCNLFRRAEHHHRWYLKKFKDYPKSRKIIFPYIY